jgi:hypothetical protein
MLIGMQTQASEPVRSGPNTLAVALGCVLAIGFVCWLVVVSGLPAKYQQTRMFEMDQENAALCERFGFATGTAQHVSCKVDLMDLRNRHEQRLANESIL